MEYQKGHIISKVEPQSIAADLGLHPGDRLLALDEKPLRDIFDFELRQLADKLSLTVLTADGENIIFDIEKDADEKLGLEFAQPLLDDCTTCHNRCIFCFIDQLPQGMRKSLYVKDDDLRLSFLSGTYVTLTNISDAELDRLISYHFSPMNISVHTTDDKLRCKMMGNRKAANLLTRLRRIAAGGIAINAQIVLCPDINDGQALEQTITEMVSLGTALQSLAIVPVGLTRYRRDNKLYPLRPLTKTDAAAILELVEYWQRKMLAAGQARIVYASDEIYIKSGRRLPLPAEYDGFPQLENGVGMMTLTLHEIEQGLAGASYQPSQPLYQALPAAAQADPEALKENIKHCIMATGISAAAYLQKLQPELSSKFDLEIEFSPVKNRFFGDTVTVAGLITGQDLLDHFRGFRCLTPQKQALVLPASMFKADSPVMLDDVSVQDLADCLGLPVFVCPPTGQGLLDFLAWLKGLSEEVL